MWSGCQREASAAFTPGYIPVTHLCQRLSQPQCHSAAGGIMSLKNSYDTIGNRTRDLPTISAVPQPTVPPRAPPPPVMSGRGFLSTQKHELL